MVTSVYFYGDKSEHGRELLEIKEWPEGRHISSENFKTILNEMLFMEGYDAEQHYIVAYVFVGDRIVNQIEYWTREEHFRYDDPDTVIRGHYFIDGSLYKSIVVAC